jgi:GNAT superfamily N-acetyltransferase
VDVEIIEEPPESLAEYAQVPIAFEVTRRLVFEDGKEPAEAAVRRFVKDYDAIEAPTEWAKNFDLSNWGILAAAAVGERAGGAVIAWKTPKLEMNLGGDEIAILWDLRVRPELRGKGVGRRLFGAAVDWSVKRGCLQKIIETQDINVPACRFYAAMGCVLTSVDAEAYPGLDEVQLIWTRTLGPVTGF